jgi:glucokinase
MPRRRVIRYTPRRIIVPPSQDVKRKRATIGIDIGGTKSLYALFDEDFEILAEEKLPTRPGKGGLKAFNRTMAKVVKGLLREARRHRLRVTVVGAGCAGRVDIRKGIIRAAPNLDFLDGYELRKRLERLTEAKVFVANDVDTGLYGEHRLGAARKARHVIGVWLGTGVGGALIIDGHLHLGASGVAGDLGNYLLHPVDTDKDAPRKEVLDNVASRTAIAGDAAAIAAKRWSTKRRDLAGTDVKLIRSGDIAEAIRNGDRAIEKLVRSRAAVVGAAISNLVDFINPDMVVLGGGLVTSMPELMRREIARSIKAHAAPKAAQAVKVVVAKLGDHAGTVGAAKLAVDMLSAGRPPLDIR